MRKYVNTLYLNTVLGHTVRIGICYYSLTRHNSPKLYHSMYLRLGPTVIQIVHCREEAQHHMLRHMLTVLCAYLHYTSSIKRFVRVPRTQKDIQSIMSFPHKPRYVMLRKCAISFLMESASLLMVKLYRSSLHGRINIPYSQDSPTLFANLHIAVLTYFQLRSLRPTGSFVSDIWT